MSHGCRDEDHPAVLEIAVGRPTQRRPVPSLIVEQPVRIVLERNQLVLTWRDGRETDLSAELLRRSCPCAACRESPGGRVLAAATIRTVEPAGAYGLRILFEGHESGIFSYDYLRSLDAEARAGP
jgi:DUF971 family protein